MTQLETPATLDESVWRDVSPTPPYSTMTTSKTCCKKQPDFFFFFLDAFCFTKTGFGFRGVPSVVARLAVNVDLCCQKFDE